MSYAAALVVAPWVAACIAAAALAYARGAFALWKGASLLRRRSTLREASAFAAACLLLSATLGQWLDALAERSFTMHMVQHELLMLAVAPLFVLARPLGTWAWALPSGFRPALPRVLHLPILRRPWMLITRPLGATLLQLAALWLWHAPRLFNAALAGEGVHGLQHISFLLGGCAFWWAMRGNARDRSASGRAIGGLFLTMIASGGLGALLTFTPHVWYAGYRDATAPLGLTPLDDQQLGGIVMWVGGGLVYAAVAWWHAAQFLRARPQRASWPPVAPATSIDDISLR